MMTRTLILALSLTAAAAPVMAAETGNPAVEVRIDDLNLTRTADRERLDTRLKSAARSLCYTRRCGKCAPVGMPFGRPCPRRAPDQAGDRPRTERHPARAADDRRRAISDGNDGFARAVPPR